MVGIFVGLGISKGLFVGHLLGALVGLREGVLVGRLEGVLVGNIDGMGEGASDGVVVGLCEGVFVVGVLVGILEGVIVGKGVSKEMFNFGKGEAVGALENTLGVGGLGVKVGSDESRVDLVPQTLLEMTIARITATATRIRTPTTMTHILCRLAAGRIGTAGSALTANSSNSCIN